MFQHVAFTRLAQLSLGLTRFLGQTRSFVPCFSILSIGRGLLRVRGTTTVMESSLFVAESAQRAEFGVPAACFNK